jgi:hypothetical protein
LDWVLDDINFFSYFVKNNTMKRIVSLILPLFFLLTTVDAQPTAKSNIKKRTTAKKPPKQQPSLRP